MNHHWQVGDLAVFVDDLIDGQRVLYPAPSIKTMIELNQNVIMTVVNPYPDYYHNHIIVYADGYVGFVVKTYVKKLITHGTKKKIS